ncbi:MAG TPA: aminomethyl-transferring glycine dehydrogenase subunit GcvPA, partial [Burkholderiales bacterium]|nr:aminomethyl-transferring glycine dehydrogenase subunit GcvPA [Burkholderiales bacterium]
SFALLRLMPFIPHTAEDIRAMLGVVGIPTLEALYDEIPQALRGASLEGVPRGMNEFEITRLVAARAEEDRRYASFLGAGAYEHHIPAAVWQIATRGEYYSPYTPYQAEASQGTLQLLYEYQSMMASLTGLDISNASLYDGASALAEAVLMAVRIHKSSRRVLVPRSVDPVWRSVVRTITHNQRIELIELPYDAREGCTLLDALKAHEAAPPAALIVPQPNFFGVLEPVDELTEWAHGHGVLSLAVVNPTALAILRPPGEWGAHGADIAAGEAQPLGIPLANGGPYLGFLTCREALVRQMPGRLVGRTVDAEGRPAYTLTLQAREQHIRRSKATSNICTNQGLMVTAATIYLALLGPQGLRDVAQASHARASKLLQKLAAIDGVEAAFSGAFFHEFVIRLPRAAQTVLHALEGDGILGGLDLGRPYPELPDHMLVCATETKNDADLQRYADALARILAAV